MLLSKFKGGRAAGGREGAGRGLQGLVAVLISCHGLLNWEMGQITYLLSGSDNFDKCVTPKRTVVYEKGSVG